MPFDNKKALTNEFKSRFGNVYSRLTMIKNTQDHVLTNLIQEIENHPTFTSEHIKKRLAASYMLVLTEELQEIPFPAFIEDLALFCYQKNRPDLLFDSISSEEFVEGGLEPYFTILLKLSDTINDSLKKLIFELGQGTETDLVQMLLIQHFYQPLFSQIITIIDHDGVDLRFVAALMNLYIREFISRKYRLKVGSKELSGYTVKEILKEFKQTYPLATGEDLHFDIVYKLVLKNTWDLIMELVSGEIESLKETIEDQRAEIKAQYQANVSRESSSYSDDYYSSMIGMKLMEIFQLNRKMNPTMEKGIINAVDVMIRRYSIDKFGYATTTGTEMLKLANRLIWEAVQEYPQMLTPVFEPSELMHLMKIETIEAVRWVEDNKGELKRRFHHLISRYVDHNPTPMNIGESFVKIIRIVEQSKVRLTL